MPADDAAAQPEPSSTKLIGIEEHFLTAEVRDDWHALGPAAIDPSVAFHSGAIEGRLLDLAEQRLALMDETGLDVQVLSLTTPSLHDLGPESVYIARRINDALAEAVARHPTRLQAFATLPVAQPEDAARELERCIESLGFTGTMLCGRVGARHLDHPNFAPIFESAVKLGVPILIHLRTPPMPVREAYYSGFSPTVYAAFATFGLGWHYDAGIQFIRLLLAGTFVSPSGSAANSGALGRTGAVLCGAARRHGSVHRPRAAHRDLPPPQSLRYRQRHVPAALPRAGGRSRRT